MWDLRWASRPFHWIWSHACLAGRRSSVRRSVDASPLRPQIWREVFGEQQVPGPVPFAAVEQAAGGSNLGVVGAAGGQVLRKCSGSLVVHWKQALKRHLQVYVTPMVSPVEG